MATPFRAVFAPVVVDVVPNYVMQRFAKPIVMGRAGPQSDARWRAYLASVRRTTADYASMYGMTITKVSRVRSTLLELEGTMVGAAHPSDAANELLANLQHDMRASGHPRFGHEDELTATLLVLVDSSDPKYAMPPPHRRRRRGSARRKSS